MTKGHTTKEYLPKEKRQTSFQIRKGKKYDENTNRTEKNLLWPKSGRLLWVGPWSCTLAVDVKKVVKEQRWVSAGKGDLHTTESEEYEGG